MGTYMPDWRRWAQLCLSISCIHKPLQMWLCHEIVAIFVVDGDLARAKTLDHRELIFFIRCAYLATRAKISLAIRPVRLLSLVHADHGAFGVLVSLLSCVVPKRFKRARLQPEPVSCITTIPTEARPAMASLTPLLPLTFQLSRELLQASKSLIFRLLHERHVETGWIYVACMVILSLVPSRRRQHKRGVFEAERVIAVATW